VIFDKTDSSLYCHPTCFSFTYWTIAITWILILMLTLLLDPISLLENLDQYEDQTKEQKKSSIESKSKLF
jgi:hypothetical protein